MIGKTVANGVKFMRFGPCTKLLSNGETFLDDLVLNLSDIKILKPRKVRVGFPTCSYGSRHYKYVNKGALIETFSGERFQFPPTNVFAGSTQELRCRLTSDTFFDGLANSLQKANEKGFADISVWYGRTLF